MAPPSNQPPRRRPATGNNGAVRSNTGAQPRRTGNSPAVKAAPPARLVCQAGPSNGQEFPLEGDEVVIGRAADNPVSIPDTSVSRKHAIVRRTRSGWAVSDLGSGNGTLLNGEAVAEETLLQDGDLIALGDTELLFQSGQAPAAAPEPEATGPDDTGEDPVTDAPAAPRRPPVKTSRSMGLEPTSARGRPVRTSRMRDDPEVERQNRRKLFIRVGGALVVVLALLVGGKAIDNKSKKAQALVEKQRKEHEAELALVLKDAKVLIKKGQWKEAREQLVELAQAEPDFETNQIVKLLQKAEQEIPAQKAMEDVRAAIQAGELGKAAQILAKINTIQESMLEELRQALDAKFVERVAEARGLMASASDLPKLTQLKALADDLLVARPEDRDALDLQKQAESAIFRLKNPNVAPQAPDRPWIEVQQRFKNGDATGALSLAQACANKHPPCRQLEGQIQEFEAKSKKVESLNENELIALFALDKRIAGGQSSDLSRPLRTQLVAKLFVKASQAKTSGNWGRAIELARKVLEADPGHVAAQTLVSDGLRAAQDVYRRGYQLRDNDPDEAMRLFKEVVQMTPSDDEYHQKAKARLGELQNR